jgi:hypothetical protein
MAHKARAVEIVARALLLDLTVRVGGMKVGPNGGKLRVSYRGYRIIERRIAFDVALFFVDTVGPAAAVKACRLAGFRKGPR